MPNNNATITLATNDGDFWDKRWCADYQHAYAHYKVHPNNVGVEGAPWFLYIHGGGAELRDGRLPFIQDSNGNDMFSALLAQTDSSDTHFNLLSLTIPQLTYPTNDDVYTTTPGTKENGGFRVKDLLGNAHSQTHTLKWNLPRVQERMTYPGIWMAVQHAICWWKSVCEEFGCDPDKGIVGGTSFGGFRAQLSQLHEPLRTEELGVTMRSFYGLKRGVDSRVKGVWTHYGGYDMRRDPQYVIDAGFDTGNIYPIFPTYIAKYLGIFPTKANLNRVPNYILEQMSPLYFVENGLLDYFVPTYHYWERNGLNGGGTVGSVTYPLPDTVAHDEQQLFNWMRAMVESGSKVAGKNRYLLVNAGDNTNGGDDVVPFEGSDTTTTLDIIHTDFYRWCRGVVGDGSIPSGKGPLWYSLLNSAGGKHAVPTTYGYASGGGAVDTPY